RIGCGIARHVGGQIRRKRRKKLSGVSELAAVLAERIVWLQWLPALLRSRLPRAGTEIQSGETQKDDERELNFHGINYFTSSGDSRGRGVSVRRARLTRFTPRCSF